MQGCARKLCWLWNVDAVSRLFESWLWQRLGVLNEVREARVIAGVPLNCVVAWVAAPFCSIYFFACGHEFQVVYLLFVVCEVDEADVERVTSVAFNVFLHELAGVA